MSFQEPQDPSYFPPLAHLLNCIHFLLSGRHSVQAMGPGSLAATFLSGQRIAGSQLSPTLQYFGQSLSGGQDLTHDGLVDLAVGAQGQVLLLR